MFKQNVENNTINIIKTTNDIKTRFFIKFFLEIKLATNTLY